MPRSASVATNEPPPYWPVSIILLGWTPSALLGALYAIVTLSLSGAEPLTWRMVAAALASWYAWALFTPGIERLAERWRVARPVSVRRVLLHLGAGVVATAGQALVITGSTVLVSSQQPPLGTVFGFWFLTLLPAGVIVYAAVVGIRTAEVFHAESVARARLAEQLSAELARSQLSALRGQLQPHFLFNTLNAVVALVRAHENAEAVDALLRLGDLLRATLRTSSAAEVRLAEEVEFTEHYLGIERLRFGDRLSVQVAPADGLSETMVPTFLLQPFVENAIKHGLRDRREGGRIEVSFARDETHLRVRVEDNGSGLPDDWAERCTRGCGVANAKARLEHLYAGSASLSLRSTAGEGGTVVDIAIPLRAARDPAVRS